MKVLQGVGQGSLDAHSISLNLHNGAVFRVEVLESSLVRVRLRPAGGYLEPRTWAICPEPGKDVAWTGRLRDDLSGFSRPAAHTTQDQGRLTLSTGCLSVSLNPSPLTLSWSDASGQVFAADRVTSAYFLSERTGALRHYLARDRGDRYYGLGDKTGPLNLHGRRLRTLALDSLGYNPETGDPLYKHWPFVLTRSASGLWWGGITTRSQLAPLTWAVSTTTTMSCFATSRLTTAIWTTT
jgi:alpha-glucosidase